MTDKNDKPDVKAASDEGVKMSAGKGLNDKLEKAKNNTDTAPDEFLSPKADTDLPIDGQVLNDASLRGEMHEDTPTTSPDKKQP